VTEIGQSARTWAPNDSGETCKLCGAAYERIWSVKERRFGSEETFHVGECARCPALILTDPPDDPGRYYPADYPSFTNPHGTNWRAPIRRVRNRALLGRRGLLADLTQRLRPHAATPFLRRTGTTSDSRILDVGSGAGLLLDDLADAGFRHLVGVDRFIPQAVEGRRYRVIKGTIEDVEGEFDLIMFHHSLEHMREQLAPLAAAARLLAPGGWLVIRLPVYPSAAWDTYHEHWFQLDVPRHEYIHSVDSLTRLVEETGLRFDGVEYDSTAQQFAGSEGYRLGLRLTATDRYFPRARMRDWARQAVEINRANRGDQGIFYFQKPLDGSRPNIADE